MKLREITVLKSGRNRKPPQQGREASHLPINDESGMVGDLCSQVFEPVTLACRIEDEHNARKAEQRYKDGANQPQQIRARRHSGSGACATWHGTHRPFRWKCLRGWHMPRKGPFSSRLGARACGGILWANLPRGPIGEGALLTSGTRATTLRPDRRA